MPSYLDGGPFSYASSPLPISALSYFCVIVLILHLVNLFYFVLINSISMFLHLPPPSLYLSPLSYIRTTLFPDVCSHICYSSYLLLSMILFFPFISTSIHSLLPPSFPPPTFPVPFISSLCIFVLLQCYYLLFIHPQP